MQSKIPIWLCYNFDFGPVAQLVEQRIENPRVGSSILPQATRSNVVEMQISTTFSFQVIPVPQ
jgi:hypothetical protein